MIVPGSANPLLLRSAVTQYQVSRSLRFNSSDSAYLSRTPSASSTNRKASTYAFWMKLDCRNSAGTQGSNTVLSCYDNVGPYALYWNFLSEANGRKLSMSLGGASDFGVTFAPSFRDPSSWYHVVIVIDTDNATNSDRIRLYVNGTRVTATSSASWPTQGYQPTTFISGRNTNIGVDFTTSYANYFNGLLADIHFIDGQALDPTSFGEFSATTGVWMPKAYTGTYGTNGFRLDFSDNSAATATTLGKDAAGGNNWTPTNFSVSSGAGNDSLVDVPTNGSEVDTGSGGQVRGNYATLNPLNKGTSINLSNGNLDYSQASTSTNNRCISTIYVSSGKWYIEHTVNATNAAMVIGIASASESPSSNYFGSTSKSYGYAANGLKYNNGSGSSYGATYGSIGDVIGLAFDTDAGTLTYYKNGVSQGTAFTGIPADSYYFGQGNNSEGYSGSFNFGQRPFAYTAPSGFKALCTANLPAPVVTKPSTVFDTVLWTGNGSSQSITLPGGFSPDLVWIKQRNGTDWHALFNTIVGATTRLFSNSTNAEATNAQTLTSFNSNGFSVGNTNEVNGSGSSYVAWTWDAGSSTVTNTQGSITSSVRANASAGFSIVTYTGNGTGGATVGHGGLVNLANGMIIIKRRNSAVNWFVGHGSQGWTKVFEGLNTTAAISTTSAAWNNTSPTSTVFTLGTETSMNGNGGTFVAYCFAPVAGYSSFGSYTGNGSTDGPFVYTGFRPRWLLIKRSDTSGTNWNMRDSARNSYNTANSGLFANLSNAESTQADIDILSNGFKIKDAGGSETNANGGTYVWAAFAESPFAYSRAR